MSDEAETVENGAGANRVRFADLTTEAKIKRNNARLQALQRRGVPTDVSNLRIGTLLELLIGDRMAEAESLIQDRVDQALDNVEAAAAQMDAAQLAKLGDQLTAGAKPGETG